MNLSHSKVRWTLLAIGFLVYSNTLRSAFQGDDFYTIVGNRALWNLSDLSTLWQVFNTRFIIGLSFALNYALGRENVTGYHLFNILVHVLNSFWVYQLAFLTFQTPRIREKIKEPALLAFLAALLFVVHPIQTQSISYLWQRATSLAAFFYLGSLVCYLDARLKNSWPRFCGCLLLAVAGMFSKETVFTLPFAILLYETIFLKKIDFGKTQKIFMAVALLASLFIIPWTMLQANERTLDIIRPKAFRVHPQPEHFLQNMLQMTVTESDATLSRKDFMLTQINVLRTYLRLLFLPWGQNIDYDYPLSHHWTEPATVLSLLLLCALLGTAFFLLKNHPVPAFGIFWFFLTLSLESLIVTEELIFEHRLYLPMAGFSLFLVTTAYSLLRDRKKTALVILGASAVYGFLAYQRNFVWKDEMSLWNDVVKKSPKKPRGYNGRGSIYQKQGDLDRAVADYTKAMELEPRYGHVYANRCSAYAEKELWDRALEDCQTAVRLDPSLTEAFNTLGAIYTNRGLLKEALVPLDKAIELNPDYAVAYSNRGAVYEKMGLLDLALEDLNKAVAFRPNFIEAYNNRGYIYERKGLLDQALEDYNRVLKLNPNAAGSYSNRASVYLKKGLFEQALADADKVIELAPNPRAYQNRDAILAKLKELKNGQTQP